VTYLTAKEAGFDLLRDGLCLEPEDKVHRPLYFAIVDEADSILIDEARVPMVIAGEMGGQVAGLARLADLAREHRAGEDYDTDEYSRNINLTEQGSHRVEKLLGVDNLYPEAHLAVLAGVRNALHAEALLQHDALECCRCPAGSKTVVIRRRDARTTKDEERPRQEAGAGSIVVSLIVSRPESPSATDQSQHFRSPDRKPPGCRCGGGGGDR